jgi:dipeptidase
MKYIKLIALLLLFTTNSWAQDIDNDACTSIMVGKSASADGSVITSHTCDSWYRTWMNMVPEKDYPRDTVMSVYEGSMHTEHASDQTGMKERGKIPQAKHTFRYLNTAYPCMNEHQLGIGETTYTGRDTLVNKAGMFMIEELARVALERCRTAREAIRLMGQLIKDYGYGDEGECLTIADPNEVWIFEVQGEGPRKIGGVWAAQRIPDDEIAVSANVSRIGRLNLSDTDHFMASDNVFEVARKLKLWDGKEPFSFWKAYSGGNYYDEPKNYSVRELFIMQQLAPSKGFTDDWQELPVSVKPDSLVSVERVAKLLASYYEGTEQSLSSRVDSLAAKSDVKGRQMKTNPWMRPDEINLYGRLLGDSTMQNIRTVSVSWCAYSTIIQLRSWLPDEVGGVAWVCLDNPGQSPRFPIFSGNTQLPMMLNICGQHRLRDDAALWHFRQANRLATIRWGSCRQAMEDAQQYFLDKGQRELPFVEQTWQSLGDEDEKQAFLDGYTRDFFGAAVLQWDELFRQYSRQLWSGY